MKELLQGAGIWIGAMVLIWIGMYYLARIVSDYEVIEPEEGVRCVVVSRTMNTSVDCWQDRGIEK